MKLHHPRRLVAVLAALALAVPVGGAMAHEDDEAESQNGPLEVEARPSIVPVGDRVFVEAEYEVDDESDDEDGDEVDGPEDDETEEDDTESDDTESDETESDDTESDDTESDDTESDDTESDDTEEETDSDEEDTDAQQTAGLPSSVTFSVDWGDGSAPETMTVTEEEADEDEFESEAIASRPMSEAGEFPVTVTATPDVGESVSTSVTVQVGGGSARLEGDDRLSTAIDVARDSFPEDGSAGAVLLARSDEFADALSAASMAMLEDAPILLTPTASVPDGVLDEIARALGDTGTVYLLGGESALSPAVADALESRGYSVERVAGEDRIATSLAIAEFLVAAGVDVDEVVLASAANFPDALSAAPFAAEAEEPVLLTGPNELDARVAAFLDQHRDTIDEVLLAGGPAALSDTVESTLTQMGFEVERLAGEDRYETSAEVAEHLFPDATTVVLATGTNFADALSGAAQAGRLHAPVLLVGDTLPEPVRDYLEDRAGEIDSLYVLGGDAAVPDSVRAEANAILGLH